MIKSKRSLIVFFLSLAVVLIVVSSCEKPECSTAGDCISRSCALSKCESGKCVNTPLKNCCGNKIKEESENGKVGSECTCPEDYGYCEGKARVKIGARQENATYLRHFCNANNKCVLGVEKKDVVPQNYLDLLNPGFFKASSIIKYNKPFDVGKDGFELSLTLDDIDKDIILPVTITRVKLFYLTLSLRNELLIAEKSTESGLNGIGNSAIINVPLNLNYKPQEIEETGSIKYSIDYNLTRKVASGKSQNGTTNYAYETERGTLSSQTKPVFFVKT